MGDFERTSSVGDSQTPYAGKIKPQTLFEQCKNKIYKTGTHPDYYIAAIPL